MSQFLIVLCWLAFSAATLFGQLFPAPQAPFCSPKSAQFLIADHTGGGVVSLGCYDQTGDFRTRVLFEGIAARDINVLPIKNGKITTMIGSNGFLRRITEVTSPNNAVAVGIGEWSISFADTILTVTPDTVELGSYESELRSYRFTSTGDMLTPQRGTGRKLGQGCSSFARVRQGDEFCVSNGRLFRAPASFSGPNWSAAVEIMKGVGKISAADDDLYVGINTDAIYPPTVPCGQPLCITPPPLEIKAAKILRLNVVGFGYPAAEEVVVDKTIIYNAPLVLDGNKLYFTVSREVGVNENGYPDVANDVVVFDLKSGERKTIVKGVPNSYFPMIVRVPAGTFGN